MATHIIDYIEALADAAPDRPALVVRSIEGDRLELDFAALDQRVNRAAAVLTDHGVGPGDRVGCHLYDSIAHVDTMLGAWKIRAVPVNVNFRYVAEELEYLIDNAELKVIVSEPDLLDESIAATTATSATPTVIKGGAAWEKLMAAAPSDRPSVTRSDDDRYILYTGGTTGMPKGVEWRHEDLAWGCFGIGPMDALGIPGALSPQDAVDQLDAPGIFTDHPGGALTLFPLMHAGGQWALCRTLIRGGRVVLIRDRSFDADFALQVMADEDVATVWGAGDAHARPVVDAIRARPDGIDLPELFMWLTGAVMLSAHVKDDLAEVLPDTMVFDALGASESGGQGTAVGYDEETGAPRFLLEDGGIVLDDDMRPIAPGSGEIGFLAKTGHIPLGYLGDPVKTAATFPVVDGVRYSVPGDLARPEADGTTTLFGRGSVSINSGGEKISPEEVEKALKSHPAIFDATVVGTPHERFGKQVSAVISLREGHDHPGDDAITDHCREHLAGYKVPKAIVIVDEIVRSPSGKPDYRWAAATATEALA